ncbi:MAG TPA: glutamine--fructose-6-phosphate transaminase (isomerizing) [Candidatus Saccharimonadales bacterium]|nr:glutamine--fructose-6-phosphate transaminase (isomerizing) [Candidatus Saccharimonadales bacterium]
MCGIVGYLGTKSALGPVVDGLKALEYRGYDSAGVAYLDKDRGELVKQVGRVEALEKSVSSKVKTKPDIAIGHTRWATHGAPTIINAHPHYNQDKTIFVVHNGIIENYVQIRSKLESLGYKFISQTDTEVIPQLIDYHYKKSKNFEAAFEQTLHELRGAFAITVITTHEPDTIFAARLSSPLILGVGKDEFILASDPTAVMEHTKDVVYLDDYEMVVVTRKNYRIKNFKKSVDVKRSAETLDFDFEQVQLGDFSNFMLKEIYEAPQTIRSATLGRVKPASATVKLGGLENVTEQLKFIDRIVIVACGTSFYAGLVGEYLIEELAGIPVEVQLASEFKYRDEPFSRSTAVLAISQSGETADTIAALKKVEDYGMLRLGVVNAVGSTIARLTDAGVYCHAGPEQAVASTKAFIAQVTVLALIALHLSNGSTKLFKPLLNELDKLPKKAEEVLAQSDQIKKLAEKYSNQRDFLYIGRRYEFPCALEGALKLKEISYIHAEGYAAGEMKHGPLAMIDKNFATMAIATDGPVLEKTYSNIQEIKARGGPIIAIATEGNKDIKKLVDDVIYIPKSLEQTQPLLTAIVLQLFAYYAAMKLGKNVDRPRNLAKSVTVE